MRKKIASFLLSWKSWKVKIQTQNEYSTLYTLYLRKKNEEERKNNGGAVYIYLHIYIGYCMGTKRPWSISVIR